MNIGQKVLQDLKKELPSTIYDKYFQHLIYDEKHSRSNLACFLAVNLHIAKWIDTKYAMVMADLFEKHQGVKPKIQIDVAKKKKTTVKKAIQPKTVKNEFADLKLNPTMTLESFVVGESNQFAYTVARSIAEQPVIQYNPFFIYGGVGLGKTHLLQAIGNHMLQTGKRVIYTTLEEFTNIFIAHIRTHTMDRFRDRFRSCDLLLIDDIQFLSGKEKTQDEFFHTFNKLHTDGKQIVLTSDVPPKKIKGLEERLRSRFEWGLMAGIIAPNFEMKVSIIQKKCEMNQIKLDQKIIHYIATHLGNNIREIEGVIIKIHAMSTLMQQQITLDFVKNAIADHIAKTTTEVTIDDIVQVVSKEFNVKPSDIRSKRRHRAIVEARRVVVYLARNLTVNSMPQLALYFGLKDHSSISHMLTKVYHTIDTDDNFKLLLEALSEKVSREKA